MKKNTFIAVSLAAVISLTPAFTTNVFADVNTDIQNQDKKINDIKSKKTTLQSDLSGLVADLEKAQEKAKSLQADFDKTGKELKQLNQDIKEINERIKERESVLKERARAMQKTSNSNAYLEVVLDAENLSDLVGRVSAVNQLVESDKSILDDQQNDEKALKSKQATVKKKQEEQATAIHDYEAQQNKIEAQKAEKEAIVAQLASDQASAENAKASLVSERDKAAKEATARATALREATSSNVGQEEKATTTNTNASSNESKASTKNTSSNNNSSSNETPSTPAPSGSGYSAMISAAQAQLGKPYSLGATGPSAFDCSGFTSYAFRAAGISLPRTSGAQYAAASKVSASQAKPGDLVFFNYGGGIAHVGIYVGGGQMINAQNNGVKYDNITSGYWAKYLVGYGRVASF
ncbi:NlpC/P60 family protein [Listeria ivanovii]|uniref:Putative peptidoglycan lytic protein P45 n=1 Tax=Listeria ivanovii (strain ATCC BAA-678 / PAM 55) TaxID=881621 RepID=G2ZC85_LISIP|nr:NlpC/P60 family protein [Listeria ivanovii]AHI56930.1 peptidase P60 [Listeria ivanovii WSLC3009]AIS66347.1 peptidase P60 [Listeria ivanovii subsp. ivanovii]MBC1759852.1 peptidase P60 [Listeria ivanovii]MBK3915099.1 peptidase P60 [Listeria ivanovii subsp. ivanovii]MBK3922277.1 peptidase P60 [Listeria ivanovii subsp. ivanovii]